jgi:hypothetical protein
MHTDTYSRSGMQSAGETHTPVDLGAGERIGFQRIPWRARIRSAVALCDRSVCQSRHDGAPDHRHRSTIRSTAWPRLLVNRRWGGWARTHDRRIMRSTASCTERASCNDGPDHRTDGSRCSGISWRAGPRTGPHMGQAITMAVTQRDTINIRRTALRATRLDAGQGSSGMAWPCRSSPQGVESGAGGSRLGRPGQPAGTPAASKCHLDSGR